MNGALPARSDLSAIVVGAGPAGLAVSRELKVRGVEHVVLERDEVGAGWAGYYDSLVLHTGKHLSHLPGMTMPKDMPLFPPRDRFVRYLESYAARFELPIWPGTNVVAARRGASEWLVDTGQSTLSARSLVVATGIASNPRRTELEGEDHFAGTILHSSEYRHPAPFVGRKVLVIGVGNSAGEIAAELGEAGVETAVSVRSGAHIMPLKILGVPSQYWSVLLSRLPDPLPGAIAGATNRALCLMRGRPPIPVPDWPVLAKPPLIGNSLPEAIRSGAVTLRGEVERVSQHAVHFRDGSEERFDVVLLATGYRPAVGLLEGLVRLDAGGFPLRDGVHSLDQPDLYFVGHVYGTTGALYTIRRDAPRAARAVAESM